VQIDRAVAEPALVEQLETYPDAVWEGRLAASDEHRHEEQVVLVYEPGCDRTARQLGPAQGEVGVCCRLQLPSASSM
jgi:hypothetical protein